jgi:hypothetical protein
LKKCNHQFISSVIDILCVQKLQVVEVNSAYSRLIAYHNHLETTKNHLAKKEAKLAKDNHIDHTEEIQDDKEKCARLETAVRTLTTVFLDQFQEWKVERVLATKEIIKRWVLLNIEIQKEALTVWSNALGEINSLQEESN